MDWTNLGIGCIKAAITELKKIKEVKALNSEINIQTNADLISNKAILDFLKNKKVKCDVYSEEEKNPLKVNGGDANTVFVIDPLDNTLFFLRGETAFCSVALMIIIDGLPKCSFIGDLSNGNIYHCNEKSAYKNKEKIEVPSTVPGRSIILGWAPYKMRIERLFSNLTELSEEKYYLYNFGGQLQAVKILDGSYDAYVEVRGEALNEFCAAVIVQRAGGIVSTLEGKPIEWNPTKKQTLVIARNKKIHGDILERFNNHLTSISHTQSA